MSDPASSASLDELVAMNIAGDIEAVADDLRPLFATVPSRSEVVAVAAVAEHHLRRIAAGIRDRGEGAPHGNGGDGCQSVPTPSPQPPGGEL